MSLSTPTEPIHEGMPETPQKQRRGFAVMSKELQRLLSSKGGKSQGKANNPGNFANNPAQASRAGRAKGAAMA